MSGLDGAASWLVLGLVVWPLVALGLGLVIGRAISACESGTRSLPRRLRHAPVRPSAPSDLRGAT